MPACLPSRRLTGLICVSVALTPVPVRAEQTVRCESRNLHYNYCRVDTGGRVELKEKYSLFSCREGRSWGYDDRGVWVDHGCSAEFKVGRHGGHDKAVVGAVVGLAALAAIMASRHKQDSQEVASWAVGSYRGSDDQEGVTVELTILPGGRVTGRAGTHDFTGSLQGDRLEAGRQRFRIQQADNGFSAVDERNDNHRVRFERSGSGY